MSFELRKNGFSVHRVSPNGENTDVTTVPWPLDDCQSHLESCELQEDSVG